MRLTGRETNMKLEIRRDLQLFIILLFILGIVYARGPQPEIFIRINQVGYLSNEPKIAIAFAREAFARAEFEIRDAATGKRIWGPHKVGKFVGAYGNYAFHLQLDFSDFSTPGRYLIRMKGTESVSLPFNIGDDVYNGYHESILKYIQQQRCGYNPFLDEVCHQKDGRTMYGPMPDSSYIDVSGGWHDAADYLRYHLTSGNTVCRLLFSYSSNKGKFVDHVNDLGQAFPNGIPDILDEAKWGLDWMHKMHPETDQLFHQVADDRDHIGWKLPHLDTADYGWGPGSYRVAYYANGQPQGLGRYQNTSTGVANIAGRFAAAMAMAYDIWKNDLNNPVYAAKCLQAAEEVYRMGLKQPGCQEGTPHLAPYRYCENTWADDMEWGAAELYRLTGNESYLKDAKRFARLINTTSWMGADTARHYEMYPFMNMGHYALFQVADEAFRDTLVSYYKDQIEAVKRRAEENPYNVGHPFIWCSNNLAAAFVTQCLLYEQMTGDTQYHSLMQAHRDWLLGRNPWGASQMVDIPKEGGNPPQQPHSCMVRLLNRQITGGLNDGPVYTSIYRSLKGIRLFEDDEYAAFQSDKVVYHDDIGDYSTNEPTLDGTAETSFFLAFFTSLKK